MPERVPLKREQKPALRPRPRSFEMQSYPTMHHERLMGRVVIMWSKLEGVMQDILWDFFGLEIEDGRLITVRMDASELISLLKKLAPTRISDETKRLDFIDVLTKMEDRREDRNFIVHGTWGMYRDPADPMSGFVPVALSLRPKSPNPTELISETFPDGRMYTIIDDIVAAVNFLVRFLVERNPSRGIPPQAPPQY